MVTEDRYNQFLAAHKLQLVTSQVPEHFWRALFDKLVTETFDAGNTFQLIQIEYDKSEKEPYDFAFQLQIKVSDGICADDPLQIYLIDHAWTFRIQDAKTMLAEHDNLLQRLANLMNLDSELPKEELIEAVFDEMWCYTNTYSMQSAATIENRMPIWYIMDEVGSAMRISEDPNFRMVPFFFIDQQITYSIIFPIKDCDFTTVVTRNVLEKDSNSSENERNARMLPWVYTDFSKCSFKHKQVSPDYFLSGHIEESLPILDKLKEKQTVVSPLKVFSEYDIVCANLADNKVFPLVDTPEEADILWYTSHFKKFEELSLTTPHKFVNQFPFEYILTVKDLLCIVCRLKSMDKDVLDLKNLEMLPKWLPVTYNLNTEIVEFVSYFQNRQCHNLDNHWIIKPFNLARGLDTHVTNNLNFILRVASSGPKIVQKYIDRPVLFERPDIGKVKFDVRYVILLKSVKPLEVYVYNNFFLRFALQPFSLDNLHVYEKHFTVMNYCNEAQLQHVLCKDFIDEWPKQYSLAWKQVEKSIHTMIRDVFECATVEPPPCGISASPQSRALYAADIMLEHANDDQMQPKLLEINWMPDCKRACQYYPSFYDDIFKLLFLDVENDELFTKVSS